MDRPPSLADTAIDTLAEIRQIDSNLDPDAPERLVIREMKRAAEQAVAEGLRLAANIARSAREVREVIAETRRTTAK